MNYNKQITCNNCGKFGHTHKQCSEPITSLGIICIKVNDKIKEDLKSKLVHDGLFDISKNIIIDIIQNLSISNEKNQNEENQNKEKNNINYLIVRRKHSLGYIEFIRGRYETDNLETVYHLIRQMTPSEIKDIKTKEFKDLWEEVWKKTSYNKLYLKEMEDSLEKFNFLKDNNILDDKLKNDYDEPEWGFPKGRRNPNEKNLKCALREFWEETSIDKNNLIVLNKLFPIQEIFYGTNGIKYKHIYYIAIYDGIDEIGLEKLQEDQLTEIGDIKWINLKDSLKLFRPYHEEKKKLLISLENFLIKNIE
jgi:8-oxo-dGTP pyrophosphatase MutT (NUDIX family)